MPMRMPARASRLARRRENSYVTKPANVRDDGCAVFQVKPPGGSNGGSSTGTTVGTLNINGATLSMGGTSITQSFGTAAGDTATINLNGGTLIVSNSATVQGRFIFASTFFGAVSPDVSDLNRQTSCILVLPDKSRTSFFASRMAYQ